MYQQPQPPVNANELTDQVAGRLETLKDEGLALPAHYNAQNALKAAYLRLQSVKDRQGRPALNICSQPSIANALLDMAIQGLSPAKSQCYFIVYGNELQMRRSYFGTIAVLKRLDSIEDIDAQVIHQGDEFEIGADELGHIIVTKFKPSFTNLDKPIRGAFAFIKLVNGRTDYTIMTMKQIQTAWDQSKQHSIQNKYSDQMAKRTVINRAAKMFINTSDDSDLLTGSINSVTENETVEEEAKDVTETAEETTTQSLLADFQKQQAETAPEKPVEDEKPEVKEEAKDVTETAENASEAKPEGEKGDPVEDDRQMSIDDFLKEEQHD